MFQWLVMKEDDYSKWSQLQLISEINKLKALRDKRLGLVWEDKSEEVVERMQDEWPVLQEDTSKTLSANDDITHIFIEGDNYWTLSILNWSHQGKIDVIYIDPPYNTGNTGFIYNNDYVDRNDYFPHSKWLSFMERRLRLARNLLSEEGAIVIAIDHYELFYLGVLCDEVFGEDNRLGICAVVHKREGRNKGNFFSPNHEYMLVYAKDKERVNFQHEKSKEYTEEDVRGKYKLNNYRRDGGGDGNLRENRERCYYSIYVSEDLQEISLEEREGYMEVLPITARGQERTWQTLPKALREKMTRGEIVACRDSDNVIQIYAKYRKGKLIKTYFTNELSWEDTKYSMRFYGTDLLTDILGERVFFAPKSVYLVRDIIRIFARKDSIILDFFAGSGTTGHAVIELNKEDNGRRQFILGTDNQDNNGSGYRIAEDICYPRLKRVLQGWAKGDKNQELRGGGGGGNLRYYKIGFVSSVQTDGYKRNLMLNLCCIICLLENAFEKVTGVSKQYDIFQNKWQIIGIIYDEEYLDEFKKTLKEYAESQTKAVTVYTFSYDDSHSVEDFDDIPQLESVKSVPSSFIKLYHRILDKA